MKDTYATAMSGPIALLCLLILSPVTWGAAGSDHLGPNEALYSGEYLTLQNGERILEMQDDGNLVLKGPLVGRQLWQSGTAGHPGAYYKMQDDGNLVVRSASGAALWSSKTYGNPGASLVMENDGNLVIYSQPREVNLWESGTSGHPGAYYKMQDDGNLVVRSASGAALWSSKTYGNPGASLFLDDGNLGIVSGPRTEIVWQSGTAGNPGAKLQFIANGGRLQIVADGRIIWTTPRIDNYLSYIFKQEFTENGNLQISKKLKIAFSSQWHVVWESDTAGTPAPELVMREDGNLVITSTTSNKVLWQTGTGGHPGSELVMQDDGNLVVNSGLERQVLWESHTAGHPGSELVMQDDGNLVILSPPANRIPIWASGTFGNPGAHVLMQKDGNLVVYDKDMRPLWATNTWSHYNPPYPNLVLQANGNLVLYYEAYGRNPRWATMTFMAWMAKLGSHIADFSLRELVIPGTHDSGTWGLDDRDWADDGNLSKTIFDIDGYMPWHVEIHRHWVKHHASWWPHPAYWTYEIDFTPHAKYLYAFSRTQANDFTSQLHNGIRYFDMRVLYDRGGLYLIHTLRGPNVFDEINNVNRYLRQHPREIVILDFNHFYTQGGDSNIPEESNLKLFQHIKHTLGDLMIPPPADVNQLTVADVWDEGKQVIVFYDHAPTGEDTYLFWPRNKLRSKWLNKESLYRSVESTGLADAIDAEAVCVVNLNDSCKDAHNQLWVLQGILTFNVDTLKKYLSHASDWHLVLPWLSGNRGAADSVNWWVKDWALTSAYRHDTNILLGDWSNEAELVKTAVAANLARAGLDPLAPGIEGLPLFASLPPPAPQTREEATAYTIPEVIPPLDMLIEATGELTPVDFGEGSAYDHIDGWLQAQPQGSASFPIGEHQVSWSARDAAGVEGVATQTVWIVAHEPQADKTELLPVNHMMTMVTIYANVVPALQGLVTLSASVDSSQPQEGMGPSDLGHDWSEPQIDQASGTIRVALRAESWDYVERIYAITVTATDTQGNESYAVVQVSVPERRAR